jgi:hypothetical protein
MSSLYEILNNAHEGEGMTVLSREFGLTPTQTDAAVTALLPAISTGLKQSTATVDGLGNLFGMMAQQQDLPEIYDAPETAFTPEGVTAGNDALSVIFGSPDVQRAVTDQAQAFSGVSSNILKKMLPVLAGILISGLMRSTSTAKTSAPGLPAPSGGNLGDVLGQIFRRATADADQQSPSPGSQPAPTPSGVPGSPGVPANAGQQSPSPGSQPAPLPTDAGGPPDPSGDLLGSILRQLENGIRDGSIKPVIIGGGPVQIPIPGGQQGPAPSGPATPQMPGGDILGQILRSVLGGALGSPGQVSQGQQGSSPQMKDLSDLSRRLGVMGGAGAAVFGDHFEAGQDVEQSHIDNIQNVFDRFVGAEKR